MALATVAKPQTRAAAKRANGLHPQPSALRPLAQLGRSLTRGEDHDPLEQQARPVSLTALPKTAPAASWDFSKISINAPDQEGKDLLAHELTHVVQQAAGGYAPEKAPPAALHNPEMTEPGDDPLEQTTHSGSTTGNSFS